MDVNEMVKRLREYYLAFVVAREELAASDGEANQSKIGDARDAMTSELECMADYWNQLDEWLARGGHLPTVWAGNRA